MYKTVWISLPEVRILKKNIVMRCVHFILKNEKITLKWCYQLNIDSWILLVSNPTQQGIFLGVLFPRSYFSVNVEFSSRRLECLGKCLSDVRK